MTSKKKINPNDISFEESLKKLEEIVDKLEQGEMNLDEALKLYEDGMAFSDQCLEKLNESKQKIEKLTKEGENKYRTESFQMNHNEGEEFN